MNLQTSALHQDFESYLQNTCTPDQNSRIGQAMEYALMAPGKRVRPHLLFAVMQDYGLDPKIGFPVAAAIEMVHTYSLIHDDLPAMDNDDLRRGRPSCHKAYDEATAILAGDALLTKAFGQVLQSSCTAEQKVLLSDVLANLSGVHGMIYGQELDLASEGQKDLSLPALDAIEEYKTGCLLRAPLAMGAILAGRPEDQPAWQKIGRLLGLAFQIQDDILEVTSTEAEMGKSLSDAGNQKSTAITALGLSGAQERVQCLFADIQQELEGLQMANGQTQACIEWLKNREN